ncbi:MULTISPECIES: aspartate/glutamate racemase family protein [unclassified Nocardioides]|uniref:aspartate/glutamate racemase family protein n=1 Tax=unclassified Nocardioides TaxID=2615069 RepID=UPI0000571049|nr:MULTISPECIES: aspartate/glutamate racemase family protein [unclassified Nocardioides]ABL82917.1 Asp/Glu racemase [Nocardioides sp. JS614]
MPKILEIVPVPVPEEALAGFHDMVPTRAIFPGFETTFVATRAGAANAIDSPYEQTLCDAFVLDAGCRAEEEGYDAVCVNSMSDSALSALRSRLTIPVVAPSQASMLAACLLGRTFSVITMWPNWHSLYRKVAAEQGLTGRLASIRDIGVRPDAEQLLAGKEDFVFDVLEGACRAAIDEDGADVLILGSTTMHQSHAYLSEHLEVPVLNPGVIAYKAAETLVLLGLSHSKVAYPSPETIQDDLLRSVPATFAR